MYDTFDRAFARPQSEQARVLVLAGDIVPIELLKKKDKFAEECGDFFKYISGKYDKVLMVAGNHEYYGGSLTHGISNLRNTLKKLGIENTTVLDGQTIEYEDCLIFGSTLWTSCNNRDPVVMNAVQSGMSDYQHITVADEYLEKYSWVYLKERRITTDDTVMLHEHTVVKLKQFIAQETDKKKLVITHMAPSFMSVADTHRSSNMNDGYATELHDTIYDSGIKCWVHGHMHEPVYYTIGETLITSNPRGYYPMEQTSREFDLQTISV